jgi:iron complex transport system substrate-binding protein
VTAAARFRAFGTLAVLGLVLAGTGCGERAEPTGPSASLFPVTVTSATDRPVVVEAPVSRIAVLSESGRAILEALGARDRIVGMPVDRAGRLQPGRLRDLRPDLVVASSATEEADLSRAEVTAKAPVYVTPDTSLREVERSITQLGLLTAEPSAARRLVRSVEAQRRLVARRLADRGRVSAFVDLGFFTTAPDQSLIGDLLREAHAHNVAGVTADAGPFDLRALARLNPSVYIATSDSGTTLKELRRNAQTRKLRAVRTRRFAIVESTLLEPGPDVGKGLVALARVLHPDAFR